MKFTLVITGAPHSSNAPASALRFARAALAEGHEIYRVFLQGDGVLTASTLAQSPQDVLDTSRLWQQFAKDHKLDVVVCIASALKRGVVNPEEAKRYGKSASNCSDAMDLSGLGQLMDAIHHSDRVITFGA